MTSELRQQLSDLMDGEVDRESVRFALRATESDRSLAQAWSRYHVTRDCLQRQPTLLARTDFALAVMTRIETEAGASRAGSLRWLRYVSGGAVAAAVAVVALIASNPAEPPTSATSLAAGPVVHAVPARPVPFNDSLLQPQPLMAQPASATIGGGASYYSPAYDLRAQSAYAWRQNEALPVGTRIGASPYVLLIVPTTQPPVDAAPAGSSQRLQ